MNILKNAVMVFCIASLVHAQTHPSKVNENCVSEVEGNILEQLSGADSLNVSTFETFLVAENTPVSEIAEYQNHYNDWLKTLSSKIKSGHSAKKRSETIFKFLHNEVFKKYVALAHFSRVFSDNQYNCVSSIALFHLLAIEFEIPHLIYMTPNHVFAVVQDREKAITIEMTDPKKGFDFKEEVNEYIQYLLDYKLITMDELLEFGKMEIYSQYVEHRQVISAKQLLGIYYANLAYEQAIEENYYHSLCNLQKAIKLFPQNDYLKQSYLVSVSYFIDSNEGKPEAYWDFLLQNFNYFSDDISTLENSWKVVEATIMFELSNGRIEQAEKYWQGAQSLTINDSLKTVYSGKIDYVLFAEKMRSAFMRGKYEEAFSIGLEKWVSFEKEPRARELVILSGINYAEELSHSGKIDEALGVMDTLLTFGDDDFPVIRQSYVDLMLRTVGQKIMSTFEFQKSEKYLIRAYNISPDDVRLKAVLPRFYHELAMEKLREQKYQEARYVAEKGLELFPNDKHLNTALDRIIEVIAYQIQQERKQKK